MALTFSIIVPTHNRLRQLTACLDALALLEYPGELFEVIVVDDASDVSPQRLIDSYRHRMRVSLLRQSHAGPAAARNLGIGRAVGEYLAFTDDDCAPAPSWLSELAAAATERPDSAVGGRTVNVLTDNLCSTASQMLIDYLYEYYNRDPAHAAFFTSNNLALPRALCLGAGGFDRAYRLAAAEDREFCDRWLFLGNRMVSAPRAIVHHAHALSLRAFWRQHTNYGRGAMQFRLMRARRRQRPVRMEPATFYVNLLRSPFARLRGARAWLVLGLLVLAQAANAGGYFLENARRHGADRVG